MTGLMLFLLVCLNQNVSGWEGSHIGKKSPKAPSPQAQAAAQTQTNKETAYYNALLQNMNQITPYGNLTYQNLGTIDAPKWQSTVSLSPAQQQILDSQNRQDIALSGLVEQQIGRIEDSVSTPFSLGGIQNKLPTYENLNQISDQYTDAIMSRLDPRFQQDEEALRTRLINQGIGQGSQAYQREMDTFNQAKNDAQMQAILGGQQYGTQDLNNLLGLRGQEISEYMTERNAPFNEYTAISGGTQIQNPQFSSGGNAGIQSFNIAQAMRDDYSNRQAAANNRSAATSSLFGMGGKALGTAVGGPVGGAVGGFLGNTVGSLFSDARLKENIEHIGEENGYSIYEFNYINDPNNRYIGVMAQDVIKTNPEAIIESEGFMKVNYDMIGVKMRRVV